MTRSPTMQPLIVWPLSDRQAIRGVMTDIDDTLTTDGAITDEALEALSELKSAGHRVIAITGRPIGWSAPFARTWPVDAIVAENGAVAQIGENRLYLQDAGTRRCNYSRMQKVVQDILARIPHATVATDSAGRETDIAIDHSEFAHLEASDIDKTVAIMRSHGMNATVSSIHINGWYGSHDKLEGARWMARHLYGSDLDAELDQWAYAGDSTNDQRMFAHFPNSIGVANVRHFLDKLEHLPRYVTRQERGAGFAEMASALLEAGRQ